MVNSDFEIFHHHDAGPANVVTHSHAFYELYLLLDGAMNYIVEDSDYRLERGTLLLICPGEMHRPDVIDPAARYERIVLWLSERFVDSLSSPLPRLKRTLDGARSKRLLIPDKDTYEVLEGLMFSLLHEKMLSASDSLFLSRLIVTQLLTYIGRFLEHTTQTPPSRQVPRHAEIMRVYDYMSAHLTESMSVAGLAERFFMDKNTLTRQFKRIVGLTPGDCIRRMRLEASRRMIGQGVGIQEACAACGFADYSAFFRAFRQAYGMSPSEFAAGLEKSAQEETK